MYSLYKNVTKKGQNFKHAEQVLKAKIGSELVFKNKN